METMSRILNWTDSQKQDVLASFSTSSSSASGVVSRGIDLLLSSSSGSQTSSGPSADASRQQTPMKKKPPTLTTEAASKLLEKESFEHVFLNEFLAKESTGVAAVKRPTTVRVPATPLSSRTGSAKADDVRGSSAATLVNIAAQHSKTASVVLSEAAQQQDPIQATVADGVDGSATTV